MERRRLQARLSPDAHAGWDRALKRHGLNFTAVTEALGLELAAGRFTIPEHIVTAAQELEAERRRRT